MENKPFFYHGNEALELIGYKSTLCNVEKNEDSKNRKGSKNNKDIKDSFYYVTVDTAQKIYYAFSGEYGLCITTSVGTIRTEDLLGKFISIPDDETDALFDFFKEYGYLFPVKKNEELVVHLASLMEVTYRLKATARLQSLLGEVVPDYKTILHMTLYLLLSDTVSIDLGFDDVYESCTFNVVKDLNEPLTSIPYGSDSQEAEKDGSYIVTDTLHNPTYELNADEFSEIISGRPSQFNYPGITDTRYRRLTNVYKNRWQETLNDRLIIDFLFHLMHEIGVIKDVSYLNGIEYYGDVSSIKFDKPLIKGLKTVARIVLAEEINHNVSQMKPHYSEKKLEGKWAASSLLTALYFSAFYRNPDTVIYRKCANPTCHKYFSVPTTNGRKKYCCDACRNANNQRSHRLKVKKKLRKSKKIPLT